MPGEAAIATTPAEEMAAFDALPAEVRAALDDAVEGWGAVNMLERWRAYAARFGEERATRKAVSVIQQADQDRRMASTGAARRA